MTTSESIGTDASSAEPLSQNAAYCGGSLAQQPQVSDSSRESTRLDENNCGTKLVFDLQQNSGEKTFE